ncbi:MAG: hypothetical protein J5527_00410 [Treponema sp.]|nr:hypothetical protein [Treponema sp.]
MGLFRELINTISMFKISDQYGLGAGFLFADAASAHTSNQQLEEMKGKIISSISHYKIENKQYLSPSLESKLDDYCRNIQQSTRSTFNIYKDELSNYLNRDLSFHVQTNIIGNNIIKAIDSINDSSFTDTFNETRKKVREYQNCLYPDDKRALLKSIINYLEDKGIQSSDYNNLLAKFDIIKSETLG